MSIDDSAAPRIARRRPYLSWLALVVVLVLIVGAIRSVANNPYIDWSVTRQYLFNDQVLTGVWMTVRLAVISMLLGIVLGILVGLARLSRNRPLAQVAASFILLIRGVPVLVQLLIWGNIGLFVQTVKIGVPFTPIEFWSSPANDLIVPFVAATIGLALHEAAYMAEIIRSGVLSVDRGQSEAAAALGMRPGRIMRRIVLPQALRVMIPPTGNQFVTLVKGTSLVSVIAGGDLLTQTQNIAATSYRIIEMLAVATFWYLVLVGLAGALQVVLERWAGKGHTR
ncbi:amino acid ABC transporter permease [Jiangella muralis]|uniref:amino acid ABC transporter permease n=1 Tax=Jiangella muralis TaxID=702383 RepID=UPI0009FAEA30|nr:amino acid ABC transporter permease [Jiangella muralis]